MNINEARVEGNSLTIGNCTLNVKSKYIVDRSKLLNELAKRWHAYMEMIKFLERAEFVFNCAILSTPTGDLRNKLTDLNIERMQFLLEAKPKVKEVKHEGP